MGEITLIECVTSQQAVTEVERNLADKLATKLPEFRLLVSRCLRVLPDPEPDDLLPYVSQADPRDLPILVAALLARCPYLLTFNVRHYYPPAGTISVQKPGEFLLTVRHLLSQLSTEEEADEYHHRKVMRYALQD